MPGLRDRNVMTEQTSGLSEEGTVERSGSRTWLYLVIAGVSLLVLGILVLAGVAVYVRYTDNFTRSAQAELRKLWKSAPLDVADTTAARIAAGAPVARLIVPRLGLDSIVVELADMDDRENLNRGPGHVPGTAYPGTEGNVFIAGHRTTYGAPFGRIDELKDGDEVVLVTADGRHVYTVYDQRIVEPDDMSVLEQEGEPRVTLMACHPRFSASKRILSIARLEGQPSR